MLKQILENKEKKKRNKNLLIPKELKCFVETLRGNKYMMQQKRHLKSLLIDKYLTSV